MSLLASLKSVETEAVFPACVIIVSRDDLTAAYDQARFVSKSFHRIENLSELDWEQMNDLCRSIHQVKALLQKVLETKP